MPRKKQKSNIGGYIVMALIILVLAITGSYLFHEGWIEDKWQHGMLFMIAAWTLWLLAIVFTYGMIKMASKKK